MTTIREPVVKPDRIVDAHVHLWDPVRIDWYPYLSTGQAELNMGDVTAMARRFDVPIYRAESTGWNVEKIVNVAAATGRHSIDETLELERRADTDGQPNGLIGGLPATESTSEAVAALDRQRAASRFRGVRPMGAFVGPLPTDDVLRALRDRDLVFEIMAHPDHLVSAARGLQKHDGLVVVVEHTGWPRNGSDEERTLWARGIDALAGLGENVFCKLSGLAMPLGSMAADAQAPWLEYAIDTFGVDRCFFASNLPVDGNHGTFDQLFTTYATITAGLTAEEREKMFASNAERVYRI